MISVSTAKSLAPSNQLRFTEVSPSTFPQWCAVLTERVWSPLVWAGGLRGKDQFKSCGYIAIDCDNGKTTLKEAVEFCQDNSLSHIIGTTKSHQKEKVSPSGKKESGCDRFRMVFRASEDCLDRELYEYNMSCFIEYFDADLSCKDAGRFFFPCKEVVSFGSGKTVDWKSFPPDHVRECEKFDIRREQVLARYNRLKHPEWLRDILTNKTKIETGNRHNKCVYLGAYMSIMGYSTEEIVALVMRTDLRHIGERDVMRAVTNGWNMEQSRGER